jgi:SAM-dependent methyltransferase
MPDSNPCDTTSKAYAQRLQALQGVWWKRLLDVQAPYRRNIHRHLDGHRTLDVGCGIGRHLAHLGRNSIGVDHNPDSVAFCRTQGFRAYVVDDFLADPSLTGFDSLLCAHVLEHLEQGTQADLLQPYLERLSPGATVLVICPQERGFASDISHTDFMTGDRIAAILADKGLIVTHNYSFPFPRSAGRWFTHNEFCVVARFPLSL